MSLTKDDREVDEETPFLPRREDLPPARTPLPIAQISILLTAWLAECVTAQSILPYINQLVGALPDVGGDARKVGYYTGIIMSLHHTAEALTSFPWNRLSDHHRAQACSFGLPRGHHTLDSPIWVIPLLLGTCPKPVLGGRIEGTHGRRENHDNGSHGRDQQCPRVFIATLVLVIRICDWSLDRRCPIPAPRSMAAHLLAPFLGRLSILSALSGSCFFYVHFLHRYGIVSRRDVDFETFRESQAGESYH